MNELEQLARQNEQALRSENEARFFEQMQDAQKRNAAARDYYGAVMFSKRSAKQDDLLPYRYKDGEFTYTAQQGVKAAVHAREEVCTILQLQLPILQRLDSISNLLRACLVVLVYVAYKVT